MVSGYKVVYDNGNETTYYLPQAFNYKSMLRSDTMSFLTAMMESSLVVIVDLLLTLIVQMIILSCY